jgi:sugar transferase EpsL
MKRLLDVAVASALLILLAPLLVMVAITVRVSLGRPVFLRQRRPGLRGVPFELVKFRTMSNAVDDRGQLMPDEQRLNRVGRLLRELSLDELPELINVIRGDMSLVGPRPLLMQYLDRYTPAQARRQDVKPGITGWAQVNGRNSLSWESRFELDVWYVDNRSFWLDMKILMLTVWRVVRREGISQSGQATMREFMGSKS